MSFFSVSNSNTPTLVGTKILEIRKLFRQISKEYETSLKKNLEISAKDWEEGIKLKLKRQKKNRGMKKYQWMVDNYTSFRISIINNISEIIYEKIWYCRSETQYLLALLKYGPFAEYLNDQKIPFPESPRIVLKLKKPKKPKKITVPEETVVYPFPDEVIAMMKPITELLEKTKKTFSKLSVPKQLSNIEKEVLEHFSLYGSNRAKNKYTELLQSAGKSMSSITNKIYRQLLELSVMLNSATKSISPRIIPDWKKKKASS